MMGDQFKRWHGVTVEPDCPRCIEVRGREVKMLKVVDVSRPRPVATAYECPSCDYVIVLASTR